MTKWIIGIAVVVVVGAGAWWYVTGGANKASQYSTNNSQQTATTTNPANDTSDQGLMQDSASIDAQLNSFDSTQSQTQ